MTRREILELVRGYEDGKEIVKLLEKAGALKIDTSNVEANKIVEAFKQAHNVPSVRPADKTSAALLAKTYGADEVVKIIIVMRSATWPYKPSINHIKDVETKWVMIERYIKNNIDNNTNLGF